MPGTLQLSHLGEGTLNFVYPNPKPLVAVFILQNCKPVVPFHASSLAPVTHYLLPLWNLGSVTGQTGLH